MDKKYPTRKSIRLDGYDYSSNGLYFVTVCVIDKHPILWSDYVGANCVRPENSEQIEISIQLSEIGNIVNNEINKINSIYNNIFIDKYCIMPDHVHLIVLIDNNQENGRTQFAPTLSRVIKQFKGSITKRIGYTIWQKSFNDRIIRNENEYIEKCMYVYNNPIKLINNKIY